MLVTVENMVVEEYGVGRRVRMALLNVRSSEFLIRDPYFS